MCASIYTFKATHTKHAHTHTHVNSCASANHFRPHVLFICARCMQVIYYHYYYYFFHMLLIPLQFRLLNVYIC